MWSRERHTEERTDQVLKLNSIEFGIPAYYLEFRLAFVCVGCNATNCYCTGRFLSKKMLLRFAGLSDSCRASFLRSWLNFVKTMNSGHELDLSIFLWVALRVLCGALFVLFSQAPPGQLDASFYTDFMLLYLITNDLDNARFLYRRLPHPVQKVYPRFSLP